MDSNKEKLATLLKFLLLRTAMINCAEEKARGDKPFVSDEDLTQEEKEIAEGGWFDGKWWPVAIADALKDAGCPLSDGFDSRLRKDGLK
jgi:hypothetical protein